MLAVGAGGTAVILAQVGGVLRAAIRADAGGAFAAPPQIAAFAVSDADVAVAPGGRAVAAWVEGGAVLYNERPPGGTSRRRARSCPTPRARRG